jgi:hypothetical protein
VCPALATRRPACFPPPAGEEPYRDERGTASRSPSAGTRVMTGGETSCPVRRRKPWAEGWPSRGLRPEAGGKVGEPPRARMRPGLTPYPRAGRRMAAWCDASAVSPGKGGPAREPDDLDAVQAWTRQGPEGFRGHRRCPGQTSGAAARRPEAVSLRGDGCGAAQPTPRAGKHGCVCAGQSGVACAYEHPRKTTSKVG